jgi:hypothetical protein
MSRAPSKIALYLAEGDRLRDAVNAYRAARSNVTPVSPSDTVEGEPTQALIKRKSYPLPPLDRPTELPDWPLNPSPPADAPDYGNLARVKATRAAQAARRGKKSPLTPSGPSRLVKAREASIDPSRIERGSQ